MMIDVLESTKLVVENSKLVKISSVGIKKLCEMTKYGDLNVSESGWTHYAWNYKEMVDLLFAFDSVNFCFWAGKGQPKWTIDIEGQPIDGSIALLRCMEEEIKRNPQFINSKNLSGLSENDWDRITKGNVEIPLFHERLECLRELGKVVTENYDGSYMQVVERAQGNAMKLLKLIIDSFSKFRDTSMFQGQKVGFYKRAQLLVKGINDAIEANKQTPLIDLAGLTAFADYKIPQLLRRLGVIEYVPELSDKIDSYILVEAGSREEVEIRANTVWAIERIRIEIGKIFGNVTAAQVDTMLWKKSQEKSGEERPYHRTFTIAY